MRNLAANLLTVIFVIAVATLVILGLARQQIEAPGPSAEPVTLMVERGTRMGEVAERLEERGAIAGLGPVSGATLLRVAAQYSGKANDLKFGEYEIAPHASIEQVLALLTTGGNVRHEITVVPGSTVAEVMRILAKSEVLTGEIDEPPPEGSLLPETYNVTRGDTRAEVIARMRRAMDEVLDEAWANRDPDLPLDSKEDLLILASVVEKETVPDEHASVASVFVNRLNRGMRLQSDATVVYGITKGEKPLGHGLRRSELDTNTPYNSYIRVGLPPTPIANPGRETIFATANPADTSFLYFVADGSGGHVFADTLVEHNHNVATWRKIEAERRAREAESATEAEQPAVQ